MRILKYFTYLSLTLSFYHKLSCGLNIEIDESQEDATTPLTMGLKFFGELCNKTLDCLSPFTCSESLSKCSCPEGRIAQKQKGRWSSTELRVDCVIPAGSNCKVDFTPKYYYETIKGFGHLLWTRLGLDKIRLSSGICTQNAECDNEKKICVCNPGFFNNSDGLCLQKRSMFEKCTSDEECGGDDGDNSKYSLICDKNSGRCECPSELTFDIRTLECHLPVGLKCDSFTKKGADCVPNSECSSDQQVCECQFGFRKSGDGSCGLDHGLPCGPDHHCADMDLSCRSGRCQCKFSTHQYYDEDTEECIGKVSAPCTLPENERSNSTLVGKCTEDAICTPNESGLGECQCKATYAEDEKGRCVKSYGATCYNDLDCDELAQLVCIDGKCNCPDALQVFDPDIRKCRGLVGSRCTNNSTIGENNFREFGTPFYCIYNSTCKEKVKGIDGRCECKMGYQVLKGTRNCVRKSSKFMKI